MRSPSVTPSTVSSTADTSRCDRTGSRTGPLPRMSGRPGPFLRAPLLPHLPVAMPDASVERTIRRFAPDVVHLASPIVLGAAGLRAARRLGIPTVGGYQTDVAGFARQYGGRADVLLDRWVGHIHSSR
ncbi:MAG: glycosyltransferase [Nocardioidaceae bacterium]|nr:glycosyltransferase [Nocardioidaceae bacterium]